MSDFKKRWEDELNLIVPDLDQKIKDEPIQTADDLPANLPLFKRVANYIFSHQRGFATALTAIILVFVACFSAIFIPTNKTGASNASTVLLVEVNPSVVFCSDRKGVVRSVTATNGDADVVLSTLREKLIGLQVQDAVNLYLDDLAKTGYLPQSGAIKISGTGKQATIVKAQQSAQNYFMEKGLYVAVAGQSLTNEEFCDYTGIKEDSLKTVYNHFYNKNPLYASRIDNSNVEAEIGKLYEEVVPEEFVVENFIFQLKNKRDAFTAYLDELKQLREIIEQIRDHEDNPLRFVGSYWEIEQSEYISVDHLSDELKNLMASAKQLLSHVENTHGEKLENSMELEGKIAFLTIFIESIDFLTSEEVFEQFDKILGLLTEINENVQKITSLFTLPQSVEQYLANINEYYLSRVQYYKDAYQVVRESISQNDYQNFLNELNNTYGSVENYWNSLNN